MDSTKPKCKHGDKSDKKIKFNEDEIKDHENYHVIKEADTKFNKPDEADVMCEDDAELDEKLIEAHKNAEENIVRSSSRENLDDIEMS